MANVGLMTTLQRRINDRLQSAIAGTFSKCAARLDSHARGASFFPTSFDIRSQRNVGLWLEPLISIRYDGHRFMKSVTVGV